MDVAVQIPNPMMISLGPTVRRQLLCFNLEALTVEDLCWVWPYSRFRNSSGYTVFYSETQRQHINMALA